MSQPDPVTARRARIAHGVTLAKRLGYLALLVAVVAFGVGTITGFTTPVVAVSIAGLAVACVVLPVPIVLAYGIRAAERDERRTAGRARAPRR